MNFEDKTIQSSRKWGGMAVQYGGFTYTIVTLQWRAVLTYITALDGRKSGKRNN